MSMRSEPLGRKTLRTYYVGGTQVVWHPGGVGGGVLRRAIESTRETTELVAELYEGVRGQRESGETLQGELAASQRTVDHLAAELLEEAATVRLLAGRMDTMIDTTHHVAGATAEQRKAGRQVAAASCGWRNSTEGRPKRSRKPLPG